MSSKKSKVKKAKKDDNNYEDGFIKKLKFEKSDVKYGDGRKQRQAKLIGSFDRSTIKSELDSLAKKLRDDDKDVTIGISCHYENINRWTPALLNNVNKHQKLWSPHDSPDTKELYRNDNIDAIVVFVISGNKSNMTHLRGTHNKKTNLDKRLF